MSILFTDYTKVDETNICIVFSIEREKNSASLSLLHNQFVSFDD